MENLMRFAQLVEVDEQSVESSTEACIFADGCWDVAVDISGSTGAPLDNGLSILDASKRLVESIWEEDINVIAWHSSASKVRLKSLDPQGGTTPACIFPLLGTGCKTLFITTDGEISGSDVRYLEPLVCASGLVNVVAVYLSSVMHLIPCALNLPVFAPFMNNVVGRFVICHYNGEDLRVLLKNCKGDLSLEETTLPDPPGEIHKGSAWEDFPIVSPRELLNITLPSRVEALGGQLKSDSVFYNSCSWNLVQLKAELAEVLEDPSQLTAVAELLQCLIDAASNSIQRKLLRESLQIWYKYALEESRKREEGEEQQRQMKDMKDLADRADELLESLRLEQDLAKRKALQQELGPITDAVFHHEESRRRTLLTSVKAVEVKHNSLAQRLAADDKLDQDYTLSGVVSNLRSNRARRADVAATQTDRDDGWDLEGAHVTECDICAEIKPQALLAIALPAHQTGSNTSDYALNDAFSLGAANSQFLPGSSLCVCCASFLVSRSKDCPYTRQKIATILPLVKYSKSNFKRLANNVSHWLFAGKQLYLEWQALLAIVDAVRLRGGSDGASALDFLEQEYVPYVRVNFEGQQVEGMGHSSKPLLQAIADDVFRPLRRDGDGSSYSFSAPDGYLQQLRNKDLESISALARLGLRYGNISVEDVNDVINRMVMKTIVGRALGWCKEEESNKVEITKLPILVASDLYDTSTGFPVKGTGHVLLSIADSKFLTKIFKRKNALETAVLKPLAAWPEDLHQVSLKLVTVLMYKFLTDFDYQQKTESFFHCLPSRNQLLSISFASPQAIKAVDVQELLAQLNQDVHDIDDQEHRDVVPCFSPAHMLAPPNVCCGCCGTPFILPQEIQLFLNPSSPTTQEKLAQTVKKRRSSHFKQVFNSDAESGMVDRTSGHSNLHRSVATVLWTLMEQEPGTMVLSRSCMLQVLAYFKRFPKGGQIYVPHLLQMLAAIMFDYLQKIKILAERGSVPECVASHRLPFKDRLSIEIKYLEREGLVGNGGKQDWLRVYPPLSLQSQDALLVKELIRPVLVEELWPVTYNPQKKMRGRTKERAETQDSGGAPCEVHNDSL